MATTKLSRTIGTPTSGTTFTISAWVKGSMAEGRILTSINGNSSQTWVELQNSGAFRIANYVGSYNMQLITTRLFRDPSAWYNFVIAFDTTQVTDTNRVKLYVNGVQETSFSTTTYPSQNLVLKYGVSGQTFNVGAKDTDTYWNGLMSHVHFIDGTQYAASEFGETDSTTGEWKIKTSPSVTYGNNGFFILKDGNSVTDQSGNSNNFTVAGGTLTNTKDCPDNVFCTMNPLDNYYANSVFSNGNTTVVTNAGNYTYNTSTIGINVGMKAYWEAKYNTTQSGNGNIGVIDTPSTSTSAGIYQATNGISVDDLGKIYKNNSDTGITLGTLSTSDVICFAYDNVNGGLYVRKNGDAWINSGVPTSGASKTGIISPTTTGLTMFPAVGDASGSSAVGSSTNFGNGVFGTTAIASAGTNASSNGVFEYDVPTGYTALSTKGLNL